MYDDEDDNEFTYNNDNDLTFPDEDDPKEIITGNRVCSEESDAEDLEEHVPEKSESSCKRTSMRDKKKSKSLPKTNKGICIFL